MNSKRFLNRYFNLLNLLFFCFAQTLFAQQFGNTYFDKLPQNLQLYPRNTQNKAMVIVKGKNTNPAVNSISLVVNRNAQLFYYQQNTNSGNFEFAITINAELANYEFKIFEKITPTDSNLIVSRTNVVAGDAYLITGQSNAYNGIWNETGSGLNTQLYQGEYARSFGVFTQPDNYGDYNPADTLWVYSNTNNNITGMWGTELQKLIIEKYNIPVCIINGGSGGSSSGYNAFRDPQNPMALNTAYGRLFFKTVKAGLISNIKGFFYRQGENEALGDVMSWLPNFETLYNNLKLDFPTIEKFYVFQNNVYNGNLEGAKDLRNQQRNLMQLHNDVTTIATIGTASFDGLHYGTSGHKQTANEAFRIVENHFYQSTTNKNIFSPNIQKVFYTQNYSKIILVFDEGQNMIYPETYNSYVPINVNEFFYLNKNYSAVQSGFADKNRIVLNIQYPENSTHIFYTPANVAASSQYNPFYKPLIINKLGMRALSFSSLPIKYALNTPQISGNFAYNRTTINWNSQLLANNYIIERKKWNEVDFENIATINNTNPALAFIDNTFLTDTKYYYRIRAVNSETESEYSNTIEINFQNCSSLFAIKNGNWNDPTTWSCNKIPTNMDHVNIDGFTIAISGSCFAKMYITTIMES